MRRTPATATLCEPAARSAESTPAKKRKKGLTTYGEVSGRSRAGADREGHSGRNILARLRSTRSWSRCAASRARPLPGSAAGLIFALDATMSRPADLDTACSCRRLFLEARLIGGLDVQLLISAA